MLKFASLTAATLLALTIVYFRLGALLQSCLDFPQFYFAAQLVAAGKIHLLYDTSTYQPLIEAAGLPPGAASVYFNRPAFAALLFWPLSWFSFTTAKAVFVAINVALWSVLLWKLPIWLKAPAHLRVWMICFLPFVTSAGLCQDTLLITLLLAYVFFVAIDRNEFLAGAILSLCLLKPHLLVFLPVVLFLHRRHRTLLSFLASGAFLGIFSLSLTGVHGFQQWTQLLAAPTTDLLPQLMGNLRALYIQSGPYTTAAAAAISISCSFFVLRHGTYSEVLSTCILLTLLLGPHVYPQDYSLVAIIALSTNNPSIRYGILLPWYYFAPNWSFLPVIWLSVACIAITAWRYTPRPSLFRSREHISAV
ncbi:MAG: glycosyltransferase family 87 protein [Bryobacteraceae bacterium]